MWTQCQDKTLGTRGTLSTSWREILKSPLLCSKSLFFSCICSLIFFFTSTNCIYWMILFSFSSQFEPNLLPHVQLNFSNETLSVSQPSPLSKRLNFLYSQFCNRTKIASLAAQLVKNQPAMQETQVQSLGREDSLEKKMATHSGILAWRIPWTEEPGRLQFMVSQRVGHDLVTKLPPLYIIQMLPSLLFFNIQFSNTKHIDIIVQPITTIHLQKFPSSPTEALVPIKENGPSPIQAPGNHHYTLSLCIWLWQGPPVSGII